MSAVRAIAEGHLAAAASVLAGFDAALPEGAEVSWEAIYRPGEGVVGFGVTLRPGGGSAAPAAMSSILARLDAPAEARAAERGAGRPGRERLQVVWESGAPSFCLDLPTEDERGLEHCVRWRWRAGARALARSGARSFLPSTPEGIRPEDLVATDLRSPLAELLASAPLAASGGFWLFPATADAGGADAGGADAGGVELEIFFPWPAPPAEGRGFVALAEALGAVGGEPWRELPIARVSGLGGATPGALFHVVGAPTTARPLGLVELEALVARGARRAHDEHRARVETLAAARPRTAEEAGVSDLYDCDPAAMKAVLGPDLHYHFGLWPSVGGRPPSILPAAAAALLPDPGPSDRDFDLAMRRAVEELYPFIPRGSRLYDLGCGWGGPLAMWIRDLGCRALGVTNSAEQYRYVAGLGLPVRLGGAEHTIPPGEFDCVVMLESLDHVFDKARVLRALRPFCSRLVLRMSCQDAVPESTNFDGTMPMIPSHQLRAELEGAGWRIRHWKDRRLETLPTVAVWHRRCQAVAVGRDHHVDVLREWCEKTMRSPNVWGRSNPLIETVAE